MMQPTGSPLRTLGVVLAGGRSSRFGSDKAEAMLAGRPLLDHVAFALRAQTDEVVVVGRSWPGLVSTADLPTPGLGPLGGLLGGLRYAVMHGYDQVLCAPCDCPLLPIGLRNRLGPAPAFVSDLPPIGLWPVALGDALARFIAEQERRSMRVWAECVNARPVALDRAIANCNTPADLAALSSPPADPRSSR